MKSRAPTPPSVPHVPEAPEKPEPMPVVSAKGTRNDLSNRRPPDAAERVTLIAHDLKTPLSIIMLEAELLGARLGEPQPLPVQRSIERIAQNAAYIDRLIADLLDLSAIDEGQLRLHLEEVDLAALLRETYDRAVSTVDRNRVTLELRETAVVTGDRHRLERVIANFISNALKYSSEPVTVLLEVRATRARVTVIDRGRGLTPEQANAVFDRYRRATTERRGHGLGLHIARKIIDAHNGRIGVVSTPGQGSEFFFELDTIG